jgi:hypothetical protein
LISKVDTLTEEMRFLQIQSKKVRDALELTTNTLDAVMEFLSKHEIPTNPLDAKIRAVSRAVEPDGEDFDGEDAE